MLALVRQCFTFRELLGSFIRRELRQRYVGTVFGRLWPIMQPLMVLGVYYLVFVRILNMRLTNEHWDRIFEPYGDPKAVSTQFSLLLLCGGLIPWLATAEYLMRCTNVVLENANLVKKIAFPSEILPLYLLGSAAVNLLVMLAVFVLLAWTATPFQAPLVWTLPLTILMHGAFLVGLGFILATTNVFIRDMNQLVPIVVNLWFFLTPIVYVKELLPAETAAALGWIFAVNPFAWFVDLYRWALVFPAEMRYTTDSDGVPVLVSTATIVWTFVRCFVVSALVLALGYRFFMSKKDKFADEL